MYMFGGINGTTNKMCDDLYILKLDRRVGSERVFRWGRVRAEGKAPSRRCQHSLTFFERENMLVVAGGRTENGIRENDLYVMQLDSLAWVRVWVRSSKLLGRSNHSAAIVGSQLVIFGGLSGDFKLDNSVDLVELDSEVVKQHLEKAKRRIAKVTTIKDSVEERHLGGHRGLFRSLRKKK